MTRTSRPTKLAFTALMTALAGVFVWLAWPSAPPAPQQPTLAPERVPAGLEPAEIASPLNLDLPAFEERSAKVLSAIPRTPTEVPEQGHFGYEANPAATEALIEAMPAAELREQAPGLFEARGPPSQPATAAEPVLLYRALYEASPGWRVGAQGIGDCVSWGNKHAVEFGSAVEWKLGNVPQWLPVASEPIYGGSRVEARGRTSGGWSDGSYGGAAAKWLKDWGVLYRQEYPGEGAEWDLRLYDARRAKNWGNYGCGGQNDRGRLDAVAKQHPIKAIALVTTWDEAVAAIKNGYPIAVCSGQGFSSTRDAQGFAAPRGSWAHCMCFIGVRFDREGLLCMNSWGPNWIGGKKEPADQPDGSFWTERSTVERMLRGRDSWAISGNANWPKRRLKNSEGW